LRGLEGEGDRLGAKPGNKMCFLSQRMTPPNTSPSVVSSSGLVPPLIPSGAERVRVEHEAGRGRKTTALPVNDQPRREENEACTVGGETGSTDFTELALCH
jgi:hypothetical protein